MMAHLFSAKYSTINYPLVGFTNYWVEWFIAPDIASRAGQWKFNYLLKSLEILQLGSSLKDERCESKGTNQERKVGLTAKYLNRQRNTKHFGSRKCPLNDILNNIALLSKFKLVASNKFAIFWDSKLALQQIMDICEWN